MQLLELLEDNERDDGLGAETNEGGGPALEEGGDAFRARHVCHDGQCG